MPTVPSAMINSMAPQKSFPLLARNGMALPSTVRTPAVVAGAEFDGDGAGQLTHGEDAALARRLHQLDALAIELRGQGTAHGLVGKGRAVTRQAGSLVEIQHFLSAREAGQK